MVRVSGQPRAGHPLHGRLRRFRGHVFERCPRWSTSSWQSPSSPSQWPHPAAAAPARRPARRRRSAPAERLNCTPASLQTLTSGTLTIGTDNPAYSPYFTGGPGHAWSGKYNNDPYTGKGFEAAVAYAVAEKMRLTPGSR